jgi:hypothetical protein
MNHRILFSQFLSICKRKNYKAAIDLAEYYILKNVCGEFIPPQKPCSVGRTFMSDLM